MTEPLPAPDSNEAPAGSPRPALLLLDESMRILMASTAACDLLGRSAGELAGTRAGQLFQYEPVIDVQLLFRNDPESIQAFPARLAGVPVAKEHVSLHVNALAGEAAVSQQFLLTLTPVQEGEPPLPQLGGVQIAPTEFVTHLTRGFTHKFNNILTILNGYTELLGMETEASNLVKDSIKQFQHVGQQARELLNYLNKIGGLTGVDIVPVSPREIVDRASNQIAEVLAAPPRITSLNAGDQPQLRCDPQRLSEVLTELTKNAQEAGATAVVFSFDAEGEPPFVRLNVTDNGQGISLKQPSDCLFPGCTSHGADQRHGVGLPSALGVMQAMKGSLRLEHSEPGKTTFTLTLPVASQESVASSAPASS